MSATQQMGVFQQPNHLHLFVQSSIIYIIGAGLAGCEAAWQAARHGCQVVLFEMKPQRFSPAHVSPHLAELVCSNSFKSDSRENASGVLKEEMRSLHSLILTAADAHRVPAGSALAVDRNEFSAHVTETISKENNITLSRQEITEIPDQ